MRYFLCLLTFHGIMAAIKTMEWRCIIVKVTTSQHLLCQVRDIHSVCDHERVEPREGHVCVPVWRRRGRADRRGHAHGQGDTCTQARGVMDHAGVMMICSDNIANVEFT